MQAKYQKFEMHASLGKISCFSQGGYIKFKQNSISAISIAKMILLCWSDNVFRKLHWVTFGCQSLAKKTTFEEKEKRSRKTRYEEIGI